MNLEKIMEETYPRYFEFGRNGKMIDVSSTLIDPVCSVNQEDANRVIKDRDKVIDMLLKMGRKLNDLSPEAFNEIWYGIEPDPLK